MVDIMSRKFRVPLSEQYGKERDKFYPTKEGSKEIDYFDPEDE